MYLVVDETTGFIDNVKTVNRRHFVRSMQLLTPKLKSEVELGNISKINESEKIKMQQQYNLKLTNHQITEINQQFRIKIAKHIYTPFATGDLKIQDLKQSKTRTEKLVVKKDRICMCVYRDMHICAELKGFGIAYLKKNRPGGMARTRGLIAYFGTETLLNCTSAGYTHQLL